MTYKAFSQLNDFSMMLQSIYILSVISGLYFAAHATQQWLPLVTWVEFS